MDEFVGGTVVSGISWVVEGLRSRLRAWSCPAPMSPEARARPGHRDGELPRIGESRDHRLAEEHTKVVDREDIMRIAHRNDHPLLSTLDRKYAVTPCDVLRYSIDDLGIDGHGVEIDELDFEPLREHPA